MAAAFWDIKGREREALANLGAGDALRAASAADTSRRAGRLPVATDNTGSGSFTFTQGGFSWGYNTGPVDWTRYAGCIERNSIVNACLVWLRTAFSLAPLSVVRRMEGDTERDTESQPITDHPALYLLRNPSVEMTAVEWMANILTDIYTRGKGHSYAYIVVDENSEPLEIQYLEPWRVTPKSRAKERYAYYEYQPPQGEKIDLQPKEVLHFRYGLWPLEAVLPEIAVDSKATEWLWNLMTGGGAPPGVIGPAATDGDGTLARITPDDADFLRKQLAEKKPGEVLIMPVGFRYEKTGLSPKDMETGSLQTKAEERIASAFNLPPVVAGLGAGLAHGTFSNYEQAVDSAWQDGVIPFGKIVESELTAKLLPLYNGGVAPTDERVAFDYSAVPALQDNRDAEADRAKTLAEAAQTYVNAGFTPESARDALNLPQELVAATVEAPMPADQTQPGAVAPSSRSLPLRKTDPDQTGALYAAADAYRRRFEAREADAVEQMAKAWRVVEADLKERQDALILRIRAAQAAGETITPSWLQRQERYRALLAQTQEIIAGLSDTAAPMLADMQQAQAEDGAKAAESFARAALGPVPAGVTAPQWNAVPHGQVEALVGFLGDGTKLTDYFPKLGVETAERFRDALIAAVGRGAGAAEIARELEGATGWSKARAMTTARTEPLRAAREAARLSYLANSDIVTCYTRLSAADTRTCPACWARHGEEYGSNRIMPTHPQCRCVLVARTKTWAEITGDNSLPDTRPVIEPGPVLFARLSEQQQREVLGGHGYDLYRGGAALSEFARETVDQRFGPTLVAVTPGGNG